MKAWLLKDLKGIEAMELGEIADPAAGAGEAVVHLNYAALNPADRYLAEGMYPARPKPPHILGRDGVGKIISLGPNVTNLKLNDQVIILRGETGVSRHGTLAQKVVVSAESLVPTPPNWSLEESACGTLVYLTAWQALTDFPDLPSPARILITGASGGVGVASIQLAKSLGHQIIALSRDQSKWPKLRELGASIILDPTDPNWPTTLKDQNQKIDLAIENIGGPLFPKVIESLAQNGRVACIGQLAGPVPQFSPATLFFKRLTLRGIFVGAYTTSQARSAWTKILGLMSKTNARPLVDSIHPFDQVPQAFERLKAGPMGKVLVKLTPPSS